MSLGSVWWRVQNLQNLIFLKNTSHLEIGLFSGDFPAGITHIKIPSETKEVNEYTNFGYASWLNKN